MSLKPKPNKKSKTKRKAPKIKNETTTVPVFKYHHYSNEEYEEHKQREVERLLNNKLRIFHYKNWLDREEGVEEDKQKRLLGDDMYQSILSGALMRLTHSALTTCDGVDFYATSSGTRIEFLYPYGMPIPPFESKQYKAGLERKHYNLEPRKMPQGVSVEPRMKDGKPIIVMEWYNRNFIDRY